jgi:hypothetical protein
MKSVNLRSKFEVRELTIRESMAMITYEGELMTQLELFPNIYQQRALFGPMLRMTKGNLNRDYGTGRTLLH